MSNTRERGPTDRTQVAKAYAWLARSTEGRLILEDLKAQLGTHLADASPHVTAINVGKREALQYIETMCQASQEAIDTVEDLKHGMV